MKAGKLRNIAIVVLLAMQLFAQSNPGMEMQDAIKREQVDGDLKAAIAIYQKIAADASAPRDLRARALLHQARCYEKLGQQAQTLYRQIVRDFGDQPEAVQAKARLAVLSEADHPATPAMMTQRKIENPGTVSMNPGDTDGRRAVYQNAAGDLIYGDVAGKSKRVMFKAKLNVLQRWFPSRDFSMVALLLNSKPGQPETLAIVNTSNARYREIAHLGTNEYACGNWSWDNRYVLLCGQTQEGANRLLRISIADGQVRELLSLKTGAVRTAVFSPDGHFVAYQEDGAPRILILPAGGGEPKRVYEERQEWQVSSFSQSLNLLDWTADGRYVAVTSERTGKGALHLLPIRNGESAGAPVFVKYGNFEQAVTTASGGLVYRSVKPGGLFAVYVATLDADCRPGDWKRLGLQLGNTGNPWPHWSVDGKQILYVQRSQDTGQTGGQIVRLHSPSSGEDREVYHAFGKVSCAWAVQQFKLFCADAAEKTEILSVGIDSGETTRLHTFPAPMRVILLYPSHDDTALYVYRWRRDGESELLRWEIATGQETILEQQLVDHIILVSPGARWLIRWDKQNPEIRPTSGGDWKSLAFPWKADGYFNLTPDGKWLLYHDVDSSGKHGLFRVATAGGTPERLGDFPTRSGDGTLEISPDGSKILVSASEYETGYELWSLENFVPPAPKR